MSRAGDVRCVGCSLIDNMRAGAELNRMDAPYGTTGTYDTVIGVNSPAMASRPFPHSARDDPDSPRTYGWYVPTFPLRVASPMSGIRITMREPRSDVEQHLVRQYYCFYLARLMGRGDSAQWAAATPCN